MRAVRTNHVAAAPPLEAVPPPLEAVPVPRAAPLPEAAPALEAVPPYARDRPALGCEAASVDIPEPPEHFVRLLAAHAYEAVEGMRTIAQLGQAISVGAARQLAEQRKLVRESREVAGDRRRCTPSPGPMHLCRVALTRADATVVVHTEVRAHGVTLRLEWVSHHWRAYDIFVL